MSPPSSGGRSEVVVPLGAREYTIHIGGGLLAEAGAILRPFIDGRQVVIIADAAPAEFFLDDLLAGLEGARSITHWVIEGGEESKSFSRYEELLNWLIETGVDRQSVLIAFGGGVLGDLVGFAAATLLRGVDFIQIPTTLLAQTDSSVGGKTGINTIGGKNLVGAFHQPKAVLIDPSLLTTLPQREILSGYAEVVKYGLIGDAPFFEWLEENYPALLALDLEVLTKAISVCCTAKAEIVTADEHDSGCRALLNLGHSFGHAFEAEAGYDGSVLHGEAVAAGLSYAFALSFHSGLVSGGCYHRVQRHLEAVGLPWRREMLSNKLAIAPPSRLIEHMGKDKKNQGDALVLILAKDIGKAFIAPQVAPRAIAEVLDNNFLDGIPA